MHKHLHLTCIIISLTQDQITRFKVRHKKHEAAAPASWRQSGGKKVSTVKCIACRGLLCFVCGGNQRKINLGTVLTPEPGNLRVLSHLTSLYGLFGLSIKS